MRCVCPKKARDVYKRQVEGQTSDTLAALRGSYGKVDEQIVINLNALRTDSVAARGVLAVERPVDTQLRHLYQMCIRDSACSLRITAAAGT